MYSKDRPSAWWKKPKGVSPELWTGIQELKTYVTTLKDHSAVTAQIKKALQQTRSLSQPNIPPVVRSDKNPQPPASPQQSYISYSQPQAPSLVWPKAPWDTSSQVLIIDKRWKKMVKTSHLWDWGMFSRSLTYQMIWRWLLHLRWNAILGMDWRDFLSGLWK